MWTAAEWAGGVQACCTSGYVQHAPVSDGGWRERDTELLVPRDVYAALEFAGGGEVGIARALGQTRVAADCIRHLERDLAI